MTMNSPTLTQDQAKKRAYAIKERMEQLGNPISMTQAYEVLATSAGHRNWPTMKTTLSASAAIVPTASTSERDDGLGTSETQHRIIDTLRDRGLIESNANRHMLPEAVTTSLVAGPKSGTPFQADKLFKDADIALLQIFQICNGDYSDYDNIEWSHKEDEKRYDALTSYAIKLKAILQRLEMPVFQPRRWHHVRTSPPAGGTYVIGGYLQHGSMPRHFEWAFASFRVTVDGPEWSHKDDRRKHVPIEYWTELGAHPEHSSPDSRGIVFIDKGELLDICGDLEEVRKAVFGDVGDEPNVYSNYDELSRLAGTMGKSLRKLNRRRFEPGATV
jgi:hypothetical protein